MTTPQFPPLPKKSMTHHITDEQIDEATKDIGLQSPFARYRFARAVLALAAPAPAVPCDEHAHFEAWVRPNGRDRRLNATGRAYSIGEMMSAKDGWMARAALTASPTPPAQGEPKLIGWRTENFLWETDDVDKARNWEPNIGVLPIFDGDPNTNLGSAGIATIPPEQSVDLLERCAKWCDEQARSDWCGRRASDMVRAFAATTKAAQPAVPESADSEEAALADDDGDVTGQPGPLPEHGWDEVPAGAFKKPSPTHGMSLGQRIKHVGGRENAQGYIEFGSVAAVRALIVQWLRDMPPAVPEDVARDAKRYRWLRDMASQDWLHRNHNYQNLRGAAFDAAIDAARKAGGAA